MNASVANGKPVILGEVGWPSDGKPDNARAVSSVDNVTREILAGRMLPGTARARQPLNLTGGAKPRIFLYLP